MLEQDYLNFLLQDLSVYKLLRENGNARISWQFRAIEQVLYRFRGQINRGEFNSSEWCAFNITIMKDLEQLISIYRRNRCACEWLIDEYEKFWFDWAKLIDLFIQNNTQWREQHAYLLTRSAIRAYSVSLPFEHASYGLREQRVEHTK